MDENVFVSLDSRSGFPRLARFIMRIYYGIRIEQLINRSDHENTIRK